MIKVTLQSNKVCRIPRTPTISRVLQRNLEVVDSSWNSWSSKYQVDSYYPLDEESEEKSILFPISMIHCINKILEEKIGESLDYSEVVRRYGEPEFDYSLMPKHLTDDQVNNVKKITHKFHGLITANTGFGKTEVMIAIIKCYVGSGNIVVTTNRNAVSENFKKRWKLRTTKEEREKWHGRIKVINPNGYLRRSNIYNEDGNYSEKTLKWFSKVKLVISDELENISNSIATLMDDLCYYRKYCYGFSATSNKRDGERINAYKLFTKRKMNSTLYNIIYYYGENITYKIIKEKIELYRLYIGKYLEYGTRYEGIDYRDGLRGVLDGELITKLLTYLQKEFSSSVLYIPFIEIEGLHRVWDIAKELGVSLVEWSSLGAIDTRENTYAGFDDIKERFLKDDSLGLRILVATSISYYGVDFPFDGVISMVGTSYNTFLQTLGRSVGRKGKSRGPNLDNGGEQTEFPKIFLVKTSETENEPFYRSYKKRNELLCNNFEIVKETTVKL